MTNNNSIKRSDVESAAERLLEIASAKPELLGADVLYTRVASWSLNLLDGEPEENSCGVSRGMSLRCVARDGRQGVAVSNGMSGADLSELAAWSYLNCLAAERDEHVLLYGGGVGDDYDERPLEMFDEGLESRAGADFRMSACRAMNAAAKSRDERVLSVRAASWGHAIVESFYASTDGLSIWKRGTTASCGVSVVLRDGEDFEMGAFGEAKRFAEDLDVEKTALLAVDRTLRILGGEPLPTGKYTVILDPASAASIVDEIGELFCASEVHKGRSLMAGRLGRAVAGSAVTLIDDARIRRGMGTTMCDAEGVPTGRTVLIDGGVANAYLYNLRHAAMDGTVSTGSAARGLSSLPDVGTSNLVLSPGSETLDELIGGVGRGFLVTELMGLHTINSVTGDFSLGAKGVYIENGAPARAVSGVTIADNLISFLKKISSVGSDLTFFGSTGAPTVVVEDVTIAGE
jgi:PmbA protein